MSKLQTMASATPILVRSVRHWIYQLGGLGFIPLGLLDNSIIPLPGSMDVLTIFLSARKTQLWLLLRLDGDGRFCGGRFVTYRLARKGGKEMLARRFPPKTLDKVYKSFERWGLGAIAIPALLPPPVPMLPFLFGAGAMQYPVRKFLIALTLGRMIRYTLLSFLAARYGRPILAFIAQHGHPGLLLVAGLIATAAAILFVIFAGKRQQHRSS